MKGIRYISSPVAFAVNIVMVFVAYFVCRAEYVLENWDTLGGSLFDNSLWDLCVGSLHFDVSAILYTNALYAVLMLLPMHWKEGFGRFKVQGSCAPVGAQASKLGARFKVVWQKVAKWVFVIVNSFAIVLNLGDSVYFRYTGRRTTVSVLQEFQNEDNMGKVFGTEVISHWYLFLLGILMIYALWKLYVKPKGTNGSSLWKRRELARYYVINTLIFLIYIPLTIAGMRGGWTTAVRPITISNANQYVNSPQEAAAILNTPFSLIRTIGKKSFDDPHYSATEIDPTYSAVHQPDSLAAAGPEPAVRNRKNVVVIIVESFCKQYVEEGFAPFVKSLEAQSLTFDCSLANGRKSIDGMPSILSSIPMFVEPFFLTPASMNDVSGIAGELNKAGYETAFFHGAENGSMGFEAFAKATGFKSYYGRTEYDEESSKFQVSGGFKFQGDKDFDGTWAIWDEPFLQYYDMKMTKMKEPFMTAVFTASSHHPFNVPEKYKTVFPDDGKNSIHHCIRYTDMALRKFFETASRQPWYKNTIFVLTCDHTNGFDQPEYGTDMGLYAATLLFFDPTGELIKPEHRHCIAQQIDIMPTVLSVLGYNKPYIAFGQDMTHTSDADSWAVNYNNGIYQFVKGDWFLQFDGSKVTGYYNFKKDPLLKRNMAENASVKMPDVKFLKAIIQDYMLRMRGNRLTIEN